MDAPQIDAVIESTRHILGLSGLVLFCKEIGVVSLKSSIIFPRYFVVLACHTEPHL